VIAHSESRARARGLTNEELVADLDARFNRERLDTQSLLAELGVRRVNGGSGLP